MGLHTWTSSTPMRQITLLIELNNLRFFDHLWGVDIVVLEDTVFVIKVLRPPPICKEHISRENIPSELRSLEQVTSQERFLLSASSIRLQIQWSVHSRPCTPTLIWGHDTVEVVRICVEWYLVGENQNSCLVPIPLLLLVWVIESTLVLCNIYSFLFKHKINLLQTRALREIIFFRVILLNIFGVISNNTLPFYLY